jgi:hypothetical protein
MSPAYGRPFFIHPAVPAGVQKDAVSPAVLFQHKDFGFEMIALDDALFFQSPDQILDGMSNLPLVGQTKADQIRPCHFNNQRAASSLAVQAKIRVIPSPGFGIFNIHASVLFETASNRSRQSIRIRQSASGQKPKRME